MIRQRKVVFVLIALSTLFIVGTVALIRAYRHNATSNTPGKTSKELSARADEAEKLTSLQQYDKAAEQLNGFIDKTSSPQEKYIALLKLATVYLNQKSYAAASKSYQQAEAVKGGPTLATSVGRALIAERKGDKTTAIAAYKQALKFYQADPINGGQPGDDHYYRQKIIDLGGQP